MPVCAIATCKNSDRNTVGKNIIFHSFPSKNEKLCKEWLLCCRRGDPVNIKYARICSEHFLEEDYEDDMRNRLLGLPMRRILKSTAKPKLNLPFSSSLQTSSTWQERFNKRKKLACTYDTSITPSTNEGHFNFMNEAFLITANPDKRFKLEAVVTVLKERIEILEQDLVSTNNEEIETLELVLEDTNNKGIETLEQVLVSTNNEEIETFERVLEDTNNEEIETLELVLKNTNNEGIETLEQVLEDTNSEGIETFEPVLVNTINEGIETLEQVLEDTNNEKIQF